MAVENKVRIVDFIPKRDLLGDVKVISESDIASQNSKILPVANLLYMERGTNLLYPDMGLHETLLSISYKEINSIYGILTLIKQHIKQYTSYDVNVRIDEDASDFKHGFVEIAIDVEGVLAPIEVKVGKNEFVHIKHPSLFT
jgi:hypothetical protein